MKSRRSGMIRLFLFFIFFAQAAQTFATEVNPEIEKFRESLENKLQARLATYFPDSKLTLNLRITEEYAPPKRAPASQPDANLAYAPFPVPAADSEPQESVHKLSIKSIEADLQVPSDTDSKIIKDAKLLVERSLKGFPATVAIQKLSIAKRAPAAIESPKPEKTDKAEEPEKLKWDWKNSPLIASLSAALLIAIGIGLMARALGLLANSIGEGIRLALGTVKIDGIEGNGKNPIDSPERSLFGDSHSHSIKMTPSVSALSEYSDQIKIIQETLKENPILLAQTLQDSEAEWRGLRSLLPCLSQQEQQAIHQHLGPRISSLLTVEGVHPDPASWLREFVERLMVKRLQGGPKLQQTLGVELSRKLNLLEPDQLIKAVRSIDTKAGWRILASFFPHEKLGEVLKDLDATRWELVVAGAEVNAEDVTSSAQQVLDWIEQQPEEDTAVKERNAYYKDVLLRPVLDVLQSRDSAQADELLTSLATHAPTLVDLVRQDFWTPTQLALVPDSYLSGVIRGLPHDQKAYLIAGLPEQESHRVESLLPEGNVKIIIADRVKKIRTRNDPKDKKASDDFVRQFLDYLRRQARERKFELTDAPEDQGRIAA